DVNEYAFALGFLCHYMSDKYGHFIATNPSVPIVYPKMMKKYGSMVTYEQDHISHRRVEFAFDVLQTAKGNYASEAYHDFIGFNVSRSLMERAFSKTYGLNINDVFGNFSLAIETFRWSVKSLFPGLTRAAWATKKKDILKVQPTATSRSFNYRMSRENYFDEFGKKQQRPGFFSNVFAWVIRILPRVGLFRSLKIKAPGPEAEKLFIRSFDTVLLHCSAAMKTLYTADLRLANIDFDTGNETVPGEYNMADVNYGNLLLKLSENKFELLTEPLKQNILDFYSHPNAVIVAKKDAKEWEKISLALEQLRVLQP
ncbi:MAG: zinc dependent phospholipase C family protein, partial [Ferruginibacter sp.]